MQAIDFAVDPDQPDEGHLLLGTVSEQLDPETWAEFERFVSRHPGQDHPLDTWGRQAVLTLAAPSRLNTRFPDDQPIFPLVSEAARVFPTLSKSPLGMLVSTRFGLLFGIRGWVHGPAQEVQTLAVECGWEKGDGEAPCDSCLAKPCLSTCPVGAFSTKGYDYPKCVNELKRQLSDGACWAGGCLARAACPLSTAYSPRQAAFHHKATLQALTAI